MKVFRSIDKCAGRLGPTVGTAGNFDGLHRAHCEILRRVRKEARTRQRTSLLVTFDPHPARILNPDHAPPLLTTLDQKLELVEEQGMEAAVVVPFDRDFAAMTPGDFVERVLRNALKMEKIFVGPNFFFGRNRGGDVHFLRTRSPQEGPEVVVLEPVVQRGSLVNSTRIRGALREGEIELVQELLGRPYFIDGKVVPGREKGKRMGIPTANLEVENEIIPLDGVYVTEAVHRGVSRPAVTNIGDRPTFADAGHAVEIHLLDFRGNIYGEPIRLRFLTRLREERRFSTPGALREQIDRDITETRGFFDRRR